MKIINPKQQGLTLIELLITVVIISILLSITIPTYHHVMITAKRNDAKTTLLAMAARMEHDYTQRHRYIDDNGAAPTLQTLGIINPHEDYIFSLSATADDYVLYATPIKDQATSDLKCGTLTLNQLGEKGASKAIPNSNGCW